jgi:D-alanyl-D-alanine dipeptidase
MTADHETRRERLAAEVAEERLAAVVVAPSPDLVYLTGYGPMPLERLTALVIQPDGAAVMVVPELERQLALDSAAGQSLEAQQVVGWRDGELRSETACGRRMCWRFSRRPHASRSSLPQASSAGSAL